MPRINRIRIVNFAYNNDTRHILDETFNFHGGENALLNLANGGGKSVLVQLFLQPVIPNAKIQGRNLAGFFHKKRLPAYIMIEWKLDGAGGYLVTGIAVVSAEAGAEEEKSRIRYFTFTSKYTAANPLDIRNIAVAGRRGNVLEVLSFREAREMMADRERRDQYNFGYYSEDDGERYRKVLAGFGIVQEEWRNVIARINDSEGGIEEIFQKYKNSGQLLNEWIIKTVERAMFRNRSEASRLEEMLDGLVREVVENERFIVEKQLLAGFLDRFGEQRQLLDGLVQGLDEQGRLSGRLSALHVHLLSGIRALQEQHEENEQGMAACRAEEQRIQLEERSQDYLVKKEQHERAQQALSAAESAAGETDVALQQAQLRFRILQAARLAGEISERGAELAGIEEQLAGAKEQYDTDGRLRSLEYSLRLQYGSKLEAVAAALAGLHEEKGGRERRAEETGQELQAADREKGLLDHECGGLEGRKGAWEKEEREVMRRLGLTLRRNLLGELESAEISKAGTALGLARDGLAGERLRLQAEQEAGARRSREIDAAGRDLREACSEERVAQDGLEKEIVRYEQEERLIGEILNRHGLAAELKFEPEHLATAFGQLLRDLEARRDEAARGRDEAEEALQSLKNGRLHIPQEWAELLARLDIEYDTGEAYLRRQEPELRRRLLEGNPVLPYAYIMSGPDIYRMAQAAAGMTGRRVIPLIAYEDLGMTLESEGRLARTGEGVAFICLYEGRVFDSEGLAELVSEFERRRDETREQRLHYVEAYQAAVADRAACGRFEYGAGHRRQLEQQRSECAGRLQELQTRISGLAEERERLTARDGELEQELESLRDALREAGERVVLFNNFIAGEESYQACRTRLAAVLDQIATLNARKPMLAGRVKNLQQEIQGLQQEIWVREREQQETGQRFNLYREAPSAETVDGSIDDLEQRLAALKHQYGSSIEQWEQRKQRLAEECRTRQSELRKLGLGPEEYAGAIYDEQAAERVEEEIAGLRERQRENQGELNRANREEASAGTDERNALSEVLRLGVEAPLPPEEISGGFGERRRQTRQRLQELGENSGRIARQRAEYIRLRERIEQAIDPGAVAPESGFTPEPDVGAQAAGLEKLFRQLQDENKKVESRLRERYLGLKADYRERDNQNIDNIFKGLDPLWDRASLEFDSYYYLYERMSQHESQLADLITLYENQLANLERNKKDMVQQSFLHGRMIYEEIGRISESSKVRLQGRTKAVQMLKIEMRYDSGEAAGQRMAEYIEECVRRVREQTRQEKRDDEIAKTVAKLMSSRELLNVFLGSPNIPVSVFKIDLNMQNSHLKLWEDAVRQNSGGEKFVVFFSVLSALMSYTRARAMEAANADAETGARVLLMDNPFGPISSEHLLGPLFEIARKHRTQLICLSDLKQNSIMNCFNLIYMLKVRPSAIGSNEYLKFEEVIRDESAIQTDERLEKAVYRASEVRQLSLFDVT